MKNSVQSKQPSRQIFTSSLEKKRLLQPDVAAASSRVKRRRKSVYPYPSQLFDIDSPVGTSTPVFKPSSTDPAPNYPNSSNDSGFSHLDQDRDTDSNPR